MNVLILNGSPHPQGNTKAMIEAFVKGAAENRNNITVFDVCKKQIAGCKGCEYWSYVKKKYKLKITFFADTPLFILPPFMTVTDQTVIPVGV